MNVFVQNKTIRVDKRDFSNSYTVDVPAALNTGITAASVVLQGFDLAYDGDDHHVRYDRINIENVSFTKSSVSYNFECFVGDNGGNNFAGGSVTLVVTAFYP